MTLGGFWAGLGSMRTYHKPGRIKQLVKKADHPSCSTLPAAETQMRDWD